MSELYRCGFQTHCHSNFGISKVAILGTTSYPTNQWRLLALVELDPRNTIEYIDIRPICTRLKSPACWVTHLKVVFISYVPTPISKSCTVTRFQVFGSTLMQGLESKMMKETTTVATLSPSSSTQSSASSSSSSSSSSSASSGLSRSLRSSGSELAVSVEEAVSPFQSLCPNIDTSSLFFTAFCNYFKSDHVGNEMSSAEEALQVVESATQDVLNVEELRNRWKFVRPTAIIEISGRPSPSISRLLLDTDFSSTATRLPQCSLAPKNSLDPRPKSFCPRHAKATASPPLGATSRIKHLEKEIEKALQESRGETTHSPQQAGPPLLALADRVTDLEAKFDKETNVTLKRLEILREIVIALLSAADTSDKLAVGLDFSLEKHLTTEETTEELLNSRILKYTARIVCAKLLPELSWANNNGRRSICTLSALLDRTKSVKLDTMREILDKVDRVQEVSLKAMIEHRLRLLQSRSDYELADPRRLTRLNEVLNAAFVYRSFLRRESSSYGLRPLKRIFVIFIKVLNGLLDIIITLTLGWSDQWTGIAHWIPNAGAMLRERIKHIESNSLITYAEICLLEITNILSTRVIVELAIILFTLDSALRVREVDALLRGEFDSVQTENGSLSSKYDETLIHTPLGGNDIAADRTMSAPPAGLRLTVLPRAFRRTRWQRYWSPIRRITRNRNTRWRVFPFSRSENEEDAALADSSDDADSKDDDLASASATAPEAPSISSAEDSDRYSPRQPIFSPTVRRRSRIILSRST